MLAGTVDPVKRLLVEENHEAVLAPVPFVEQGEVECRGDVLGGEEAEVVGFLVVSGEEGAEVCEFGVRRLGIVVGKSPRGVAPGLEGVVELDPSVPPRLNQL